MTTPRLMALVKLFERREHALAFTQGRLWMNTLAHFREYVDPSGVLRGDPYEGVAGIFQPSRLGMLKIGECEIAPESLAEPLRIHGHLEQNWNVLCMYSLNTKGLAQEVSAETLHDMKKSLQMHEQCLGFGNHVVVVTDTRQFQEKVCSAIRKTGMGATADLVDYFDEETFHGFFEPARIPFKKRARYSYQREWRVVIHHHQNVSQPMTLDVGDLSDITQLTTPTAFNEQLELQLPDGSRA